MQENTTSSSKNRKQKKQQQAVIKNTITLCEIKPLTENQRRVFDSFDNEMHLFLHGAPGTGKSFLSIYLSLESILIHKEYEKLIIVRSAEPSKNVGFLPGKLGEKTKALEAPYYGIFNELFNRGDAYDLLKSKNTVEFMSTSYIRGITLDNCLIVVDECQNLEWNELFAIMTRIGKNSRICFCGDYQQSDLKNNYSTATRREDILKFRNVIKSMKSFADIEFGYMDIQRSETVKEFIIAANGLGYI